jgi:hypothetical protein
MMTVGAENLKISTHAVLFPVDVMCDQDSCVEFSASFTEYLPVSLDAGNERQYAVSLHGCCVSSRHVSTFPAAEKPQTAIHHVSPSDDLPTKSTRPSLDTFHRTVFFVLVNAQIVYSVDLSAGLAYRFLPSRDVTTFFGASSLPDALANILDRERFSTDRTHAHFFSHRFASSLWIYLTEVLYKCRS